jgi:DNA-binding NarL/FixJ family response regulator
VKRILHRSSRVRVLLLSAHVQDRFIDQALKARASAYVTKTEPPEALVAAVRTVAAGGTYFSSEIRERLAVEGERGAVIVGADNVKSRSALLTAREVEILGLVARGLPKKQIATELVISRKTVDKHCENLMTKLDSHDRVNLARFAI